MEISELRTAITAILPDAEIALEGEGCNFSALVISKAFRGLAPVKRQQLVLSALSNWLASGALHAVSLQTLTPDEPRPPRTRQAGDLIRISR